MYNTLQRYRIVILNGNSGVFIQFYILAISIVFLCFALLAEIGWRLNRSLLVNIHGVLRAVFAPMPPVPFASPNILNQSHHCVLVFSQLMSLILSLNKHYCLPVQHKYKRHTQQHKFFTSQTVKRLQQTIIRGFTLKLFPTNFSLSSKCKKQKRECAGYGDVSTVYEISHLVYSL